MKVPKVRFKRASQQGYENSDKGAAAFYLVDKGTADGTADLYVGEKKVSPTVVQETGDSTTAVMSQKSVTELVGDVTASGYVFKGLCTPATVPVLRNNTFYLAIRAGVYENFGGLVVADYSIIKCDDLYWNAESTGIPFNALTQANIKQVSGESTTDVMSQKAVTDVSKDIINAITWKQIE